MTDAKIDAAMAKTTRPGINMVILAVYTLIVSSVVIFRSFRMTSMAGVSERSSRSVDMTYSSPEKNRTFGRGNDFVTTFRRALKADEITAERGFVPFLIRDGKLLCRRCHREQIRARNRARSITEMIRYGLETYDSQSTSMDLGKVGLPLLLLHVDWNGCSIEKYLDRFSFPRITWSHPSPKYGTGLV